MSGSSSRRSSGTKTMRIPQPGVCAEKSPELLPGQLLVVDVDDWHSARPAVVDDAAEHVTPRRPLVPRRVVLDLRAARRDLHGDVVIRGCGGLGGPDHLVEAVEDLLVGHLVHRGPEEKVGGAKAGFLVRDDRAVSLPRDRDLRERGDSWPLQAHGDAPGDERWPSTGSLPRATRSPQACVSSGSVMLATQATCRAVTTANGENADRSASGLGAMKIVQSPEAWVSICPTIPPMGSTAA